MRLLSFSAILLAALCWATTALAHAALISSDPMDGAVLSEAPQTIVLIFSEPVTPVTLQAIDPAGASQPLADVHVEGNQVIAALPRGTPGSGSLTVSWRVISADSHPVGGSFVFSIGQASATAPAVPNQNDPVIAAAVWAALALFLIGAVFGTGGAFFLTWLAPEAPTAIPQTVGAVVVGGLVMGVATVGLQGVDTLGQGVGGLATLGAWQRGLFSTYGATWVTASAALVLAVASLRLQAPRLRLLLSALALLYLGVSFSFSGHSVDTPYPALTAGVIVVHVVTAAFWVGALPPLAMLLARRDPGAGRALVRFSSAIPFAVVPLVGAGLILALVQLTAISDLWLTSYGLILSAKLIAVLLMFALAAYNRYRLTKPATRLQAKATASMTATTRSECVLAVVVLALVAGWRLTPPPRSLAAIARPLYAMAMSSDGATMANVNFSPGHVGKNTILIQLADREMRPLQVDGVSVSLADPDAGIEPITRPATKQSDTVWVVNDVTLPLAGRWVLSVQVLLSEFEEAQLGTAIAVAP